jgi:preprotein translocase subunit YajC
VNAHWLEAADIAFNVTLGGIVQTTAQLEDDFHKVELNRAPQAMLLANETVYSLSHWLTPGFNIIVAHDLSTFGGGIFNPATGGLLVQEDGARGLTASGLWTQMLGQMVGLARAVCDSADYEDNIMATECGDERGPGSELDECQRKEARAVATKRLPWAGGGVATCPCDGCGWPTDILMELAIGGSALVLAVLTALVSYKCYTRRQRRKQTHSA